MFGLKKSRWIPGLLLLLAAAAAMNAQEVVDKTVATVSNGAQTQLITYSDIMWLLALEPRIPLEKPRSEDLNQALKVLIDQRIFALEAERVPRPPATPQEIAAKIADLLKKFPTAAAFEARLKQVGFDSVKDPNFENLITRQIAIEKFVDFRFASFVVVTSDEEAKYYRDTFTPDFRRRTPGEILPTLDEKRSNINDILTQQKISTAIERFLDEAKRRVEIEILIAV